MSGVVHLTIGSGVARVVFDRPSARNAMTWAMYDGLGAACDQIAADPAVRVATFRGAGGDAFVSGTDINQFRAFQDGEDGIAYEDTIDARVAQLERLPIPTLAIIDGWTMGGGLALAAACDLRIATPAARFGVPIARTLGNCLSVANVARVVAAFGVARAKRLLLLADTLQAAEALDCGFLFEIADADTIGARADAICDRLQQNAPITMRVSKEAIRRLAAATQPDGSDLIREAYGSRDFKIGVESFVGKRKADWTGT